MAGYELERLWILPKKLPRTHRAVLMVDSMKSVTANAFLEPFIRTGIDGRRNGHLLVKSRIENRDLRDASQNLLDNFHAFQFCLNVQRRKCRNALNFRVDLESNCGWIHEMCAAAHHSVSDDVNVCFGSNRPRITIPRAAQQTLYDLLARGTLHAFFQNGPLAVLHREGRGIVVPFDPPLPQRSRGDIRWSLTNLVQARLVAARTGIEYKYFHRVLAIPVFFPAVHQC